MNTYFLTGLWFGGKNVSVPGYCVISMGQGSYFSAEITSKSFRESLKVLLNIIPNDKLSLYGVYSILNPAGKKSRRFINPQKHSYVKVSI